MKKEKFLSEGGVEKGKNVRIVLKFLRHGERTPSGELEDYGREVTRERARKSGILKDDFDAVKAVGSQAGPKVSVPIEGKFNRGGGKNQAMGRSLESAHIYAREIGGDETLRSRPNDVLSYMTLISPFPFDYDSMYKASLPKDFEKLSPQEKAIANKRAQSGVVPHLISFNATEAQTYKKEVAGAFATFILHYEELGKRLNPGFRVLMPAGTHGGSIEPFLQQVLVRRTEDGKEIKGFENLDEIGGEFDPSEAFDVEIKLDELGKVEPFRVKWDNPARPKFKEMFLDSEKIRELAAFYRKLHPVEKFQRE